MNFKHVPAEDDSVDPTFDLCTSEGIETGFYIQDCRSHSRVYVACRCGYEVPGDEGSFYSEELGMFGSLAKAKAAVEEAYRASLH